MEFLLVKEIPAFLELLLTKYMDLKREKRNCWKGKVKGKHFLNCTPCSQFLVFRDECTLCHYVNVPLKMLNSLVKPLKFMLLYR